MDYYKKTSIIHLRKQLKIATNASNGYMTDITSDKQQVTRSAPHEQKGSRVAF